MMPPEVDFRLANIADLPMLNTDLENPQAPSGEQAICSRFDALL